MNFNWMGMAPRYRTLIKDFDWDVVPIPVGENGGPQPSREISLWWPGTQSILMLLGVHPAPTSYETEIKLYAIIRRSFPTRIAVAESDTYLKSELPPFQMQAFVDSVERGRALPINERWNEVGRGL